MNGKQTNFTPGHCPIDFLTFWRKPQVDQQTLDGSVPLSVTGSLSGYQINVVKKQKYNIYLWIVVKQKIKIVNSSIGT